MSVQPVPSRVTAITIEHVRKITHLLHQDLNTGAFGIYPTNLTEIRIEIEILLQDLRRNSSADELLLLAILADAMRRRRLALPSSVVRRRKRTSPGDTDGENDKHLLTMRELQVLQGMSQGMTNKEIGKDLYLSEDTIKTHARRLYRKLRARDRAHAVALGFRLGILR